MMSSDTDSNTQSPMKHMGWPVTCDQQYVQSSGDHDTDMEELMEQENVANLRIPMSGKPKPRLCPVCNERLVSGLALEGHLKSRYPLSRTYICTSCDSSFNNPRELASHCSNMHTRWKVLCKKCTYKTISKAKMRQHVRVHTNGLKCKKCDKHFLSLSSLIVHERLHVSVRPDFDCELCDATYKTHAAL